MNVSSKVNIFILFFIPSVAFWCSGLLKEGPVLALLSVIALQCLHLENKMEVRRIFWLFLAVFFLYLVRDYLMALVIPNIILWYLAKRNRAHAFRIFSIVTISTVAIIITVAWLQPQLNVILWLKNEQNYFLQEPSDPDYHFQTLTGQAGDMLKKLPYAVNNVLFRPNFFKSDDIFRIYGAIELLFCWIFISWGVTKRNRQFKLPVTYLFLLFFSVELMVSYGLITVDADTLSRYRTVPLFFILMIAASIGKSNTGNDKNVVKI